MEGEDIEILKYTKNIERGFYVDVGCYHPTHINNCNLLYQKGYYGEATEEYLQEVREIINSLSSPDVSV